MTFVTVTASVPENRVSDFYALVGAWLRGDVVLRSDLEEEPTVIPPEDLEGWKMPEGGVLADEDNDVIRARDVMAKMSASAQAVFRRLMWNPGKRFEASELAREEGLPSANALAGTLSWPGRYCYKVGKRLPLDWARSPDGETYYWMSEEVAQIFRWSQYSEKSLQDFRDTVETALLEQGGLDAA